MTAQQRREAFARMPPNRQIDVYLVAALKFEPGMLFTGEVAGNWKSVLPVVKERLESESTSDAARIQLLWLLAAISQNYCSLADRKDVLAAASQAVERTDKSRRQAAEEPLSRIRHPAVDKELPSCE